jgi:MFS family permease
MCISIYSIPDTMSAILVPLCGFFVDKYGYRASLLFTCALVITAVHIILGLTHFDPILPLVALGLAYSFYGVALWPSIGTIVLHEEQVLWEKACAAASSASNVTAAVAAAGAAANTITSDITLSPTPNPESNSPILSMSSGMVYSSTNQTFADKNSLHHPLPAASTPQPINIRLPTPPKLLGTAYGISTAALNTSLTIMRESSLVVFVLSF